MPIHMADIASDDFERQFTLSLIESEDETLDQIARSLQRIEDGTYSRETGTGCFICGNWTGSTRFLYD